MDIFFKFTYENIVFRGTIPLTAGYNVLIKLIK